MKGFTAQAARLACLMILVGSAAGCSGMGRYNVIVRRDSKLGNATVTVDLVGVNQSEHDQYYQYSMRKYWSPGDWKRQDADKHVIAFEQRSGSREVFSKTHAKWQEWKKKRATYMFVLADLSGIVEDQPGDADPRRQIVPLDKSRWKWKYWFLPVMPDIEILIKPSGITLVTPPKPKE